jgi:hypothetical protein
MNRFFIFLFSSFTLVFLQVKAQEQKITDLSQLNAGVGYMPVLRFSPGTLDYRPTGTARLTLGANYLKGYIRYNLQYNSLEVYNQQPECKMFDNSLAYLYFIHLYRGLSLYAGGQVGLNTIHFGENELSEDRAFETEVSAGLETGAEWRIADKLGISCSYKLQRIFATPRNDLSMLDFGIIYYFKPNQKIKEWLE